MQKIAKILTKREIWAKNNFSQSKYTVLLSIHVQSSLYQQSENLMTKLKKKR